MAELEQLIAADGPIATPYKYQVPPRAGLTPKSISATFDGSLAAGAFYPCCSVYSQDGRLIARAFPGPVAAGDVAEVTFAPFLRPLVAASGGTPSGSFSGGTVGAVTRPGAGTTRTDSNNAGADLVVPATMPAGIVAGDMLIVLVNSYQTGNPLADISLFATSARWRTMVVNTRSTQDDGGNAGHKSVRGIFYRVADGTEAAVENICTLRSAAAGGMSSYVACSLFRGVSPTSPGAFFQQLGFLTGASPMAIKAPAVNPVIEGSASLLAVTVPAVPPGGAWTFPAGYNNLTIAGASGAPATILSDSEPVDIAGAFTWSYAGSGAIGAFHRFAEAVQIVLNPAVT